MAIGLAKAFAHLSPFTISGGLNSSNREIDYSDFIAILLTAVTVILGALGFVVALLAFVGWNSIQSKVQDQTEDLISKSLEENGELKELVKSSLKKGGALYKLVQDEANKIIYSGIERVSTSQEEDYESELRDDNGRSNDT